MSARASRFAEHALRTIHSGSPPPWMMTAGGGMPTGTAGTMSASSGGSQGVDAVVVGGGLAGLAGGLLRTSTRPMLNLLSSSARLCEPSP